MDNKIIAIKEKVPQITKLPDGFYYGIWGGYIITVNYGNKEYELSTEEGVRGIDIKVVVEINNGVATFSKVNI